MNKYKKHSYVDYDYNIKECDVMTKTSEELLEKLKKLNIIAENMKTISNGINRLVNDDIHEWLRVNENYHICRRCYKEKRGTR